LKYCARTVIQYCSLIAQKRWRRKNKMEYETQTAIEILIANYNQLRNDLEVFKKRFNHHIDDKNQHKCESSFEGV